MKDFEEPMKVETEGDGKQEYAEEFREPIAVERKEEKIGGG